jgi:proline racemase
MPKSFHDVRQALRSWQAADGWLRISTLDAHTEGEPLRIIVDGFPELPGDTILARRRYAKEHFDHLRTLLMWEPRGHREMYGCIVVPAVSPEADFGVLFLHNEGFSTMCGHGIIGVATVAVQTGMVKAVEPETVIRIDTPAGLVTAYASVRGGEVRNARFHNVPSFVLALDQIVEVPGLGKIRYDLAFGGAFYAYVQADQLGLTCLAAETPRLIEQGMMIKRAVMKARPIEHPFEKDLGFLYGTIFVAPPVGEADSRNVCIFAEGEVDRSPTGTGVSGRLAIHFARKEVGIGQEMVIESIIGSKFKGRVIQSTRFGPYEAIIPEVEGRAFITGRSEFLVDPTDPLKNGFMI